MTSIISAAVISIIAGAGAMLGSAAITEDTNVSVKVSMYITVLTGTIILWLDRRFGELRSMYKKEHEHNKQWRLWVRSSIQVIERKLKLEPLPLPEEDTTKP